MGYDIVDYRITASVSRHNSDQDEEHDALWEEVKKRIQEIIDDPKYAPIQLGLF